METKINEIANSIYRLSIVCSGNRAASRLYLHQFLVLGDEPLLFHTSLRRMFPLIRIPSQGGARAGGMSCVTERHCRAYASSPA
jgi:hypothetical protein